MTIFAEVKVILNILVQNLYFLRFIVGKYNLIFML